jgi:hypothetical protein
VSPIYLKSPKTFKTDAYLDALIVQVKTKTNTPSEHFANFRTITALLCSTFHPSLFVHNSTFDDTVPNGFPDDVLCIFLRVEVELDADIPERYAGI